MQCRRPGFDPWVGKILWKRICQPSLVFLPGEFHGQRNLLGYSPCYYKESDMNEYTHKHTHKHTHIHTHIHTYFQLFSFNRIISFTFQRICLKYHNLNNYEFVIHSLKKEWCFVGERHLITLLSIFK